MRDDAEAELRTFDFGDGRGPVPAHRHRNPDRSLGGWVAETAFVAPTALVVPEARIYQQAQVLDRARVSGKARVSGDAQLSGEAHVFGSACVYGVARVRKGRITGAARIEKPEDLRTGEGWTAYRTEAGMELFHHQFGKRRQFASWEELPKTLYENRFISEMEYLTLSVLTVGERR